MRSTTPEPQSGEDEVKYRDMRCATPLRIHSWVGYRVGAAFVLFGAFLLGAIATTGCGEELAPPFPIGQGQKANVPNAPSYPPGPYDVTAGATIENFVFQGFPDPATAKDPSALATIQLSDFYNPTGSDVYPDGSPYAGTPKPKALLIDMSAVWCNPCQNEAKTLLPAEYAEYQPRGAQFLLQLGDGAIMGKPAEPNELVNWVSKFKVTYPATIDPGANFTAAFGTAYPVNMIVDTRTMKIAIVVNGVPMDGGDFFPTLEALLDK